LVAALMAGLPAADLTAAVLTPLISSAAGRVLRPLTLLILRPLTLLTSARCASVLLMCHNVHLFRLANQFDWRRPALVQPTCRVYRLIAAAPDSRCE